MDAAPHVGSLRTPRAHTYPPHEVSTITEADGVIKLINCVNGDEDAGSPLRTAAYGGRISRSRVTTCTFTQTSPSREVSGEMSRGSRGNRRRRRSAGRKRQSNHTPTAGAGKRMSPICNIAVPHCVGRGSSVAWTVSGVFRSKNQGQWVSNGLRRRGRRMPGPGPTPLWTLFRVSLNGKDFGWRRSIR